MNTAEINKSDDPEKPSANNIEQIIDLAQYLGENKGGIKQINTSINMFTNKNLKPKKEGRIFKRVGTIKKEAQT